MTARDRRIRAVSNLLASLLIAAIAGGLVLACGGPGWAAFSTAIIVYLIRPYRS